MRARIVETKHCVQLAIGGGSRTFGFLGFIMSAIVPVFLSCIIPLYYYVTTYFTNDMHNGAKYWKCQFIWWIFFMKFPCLSIWQWHCWPHSSDVIQISWKKWDKILGLRPRIYPIFSAKFVLRPQNEASNGPLRNLVARALPIGQWALNGHFSNTILSV